MFTLTIQLVVLVLAFLCFALAAWEPQHPSYNRYMAMGLLFFVMSLLVQR